MLLLFGKVLEVEVYSGHLLCKQSRSLIQLHHPHLHPFLSLCRLNNHGCFCPFYATLVQAVLLRSLHLLRGILALLGNGLAQTILLDPDLVPTGILLP